MAKHNNQKNNKKKNKTEKRKKKNPDGINKNAVFNCSHVLYGFCQFVRIPLFEFDD